MSPDFCYTRRTARESDYAWLWELKRLTMRDVVVATWGTWDDRLQEAYFRRGFRPGSLQIIVVAGVDAGLLELHERGSELFLGRIEISPSFQGRGLGTRVLRDLQTQARDQQKPLRLTVLHANRGAKRLYERLGFAAVGETATHVLMEWRG